MNIDDRFVLFSTRTRARVKLLFSFRAWNAMKTQEVSVLGHSDVLLVVVPVYSAELCKVQCHPNLIRHSHLLFVGLRRRDAVLFADDIFVEQFDCLIPEPFDDRRREKENGELHDELEQDEEKTKDNGEVFATVKSVEKRYVWHYCMNDGGWQMSVDEWRNSQTSSLQQQTLHYFWREICTASQ